MRCVCVNSYNMWRARAMANRRRRNTTGADNIAQAIHRMVDAMQPIAAPPRVVVAPTRPVSMEDFMEHRPAKFSGKATPDEADAWMRECEKICRVLGCTDEQRLLFVTFLLVADEEYWWQGMQTREEQVTWTAFRTRFLEKYFPDSARHEREAEFLTLQQGTMTVAAYIERFEYLAHFYTSVVTEEWRCRKFEGGLKHEIRRFIVPLRIREFPVLVEQAKTVEQLETGSSSGGKQQRTTPDVRSQRKPYSRPPTTWGRLHYYNCGAEHLRRDCTRPASSTGGGSGIGKCYVCQQAGHFASQCPNRRPAGGAPAKRPVGDRPRAPGRVFALTTTKAKQSGNLLQFLCLLCDHEVVVLFDSGATHSFVSNECVRRLGLTMQELGCELLVATLASREVSTTSMCVGCPMEVAGRRFRLNLICLSMEGLDVILGMDWLSSNHVVIDCGQCKIVFPNTVGLELISSNQAMREIEAGATCYMIVAQAEKMNTAEKISRIPVVDEYTDVFPDEIPELPPSKDVDFSIDLIPGAGPVSMAPYKMAPAELAELKK